MSENKETKIVSYHDCMFEDMDKSKEVKIGSLRLSADDDWSLRIYNKTYLWKVIKNGKAYVCLKEMDCSCYDNMLQYSLRSKYRNY